MKNHVLDVRNQYFWLFWKFWKLFKINALKFCSFLMRFCVFLYFEWCFSADRRQLLTARTWFFMLCDRFSPTGTRPENVPKMIHFGHIFRTSSQVDILGDASARWSTVWQEFLIFFRSVKKNWRFGVSDAENSIPVASSIARKNGQGGAHFFQISWYITPEPKEIRESTLKCTYVRFARTTLKKNADHLSKYRMASAPVLRNFTLVAARV